MSGIIGIGSLTGALSSEGELAGTISGSSGLSGEMSNDITHKSYNDLVDKPSINEVILQGDKSFEDLGLGTLSDQDIDDIISRNGGMY